MSMSHGFIVVEPRKPKRKRFRAVVVKADRDLSCEFRRWVRVREDKYFPTRLAAQMWINIKFPNHFAKVFTREFDLK